MKNTCKCALRIYMSQCLAKARREQNLSQTKFSERLMIDARSEVTLPPAKLFPAKPGTARRKLKI